MNDLDLMRSVCLPVTIALASFLAGPQHQNITPLLQCRTGKTPYIIAKANRASACLELLRENHGRPTSEEETFDVAKTTAAVTMTGGTMMVDGDGGLAFCVHG